jgi:virginiamycin B lyase
VSPRSVFDGTLDEIKLEEAMTPGFVGIGEGAIWVTDIASEFIYKVDPSSKRVVLRIAATGLYRDSMIGLGSGALWVVTGESAKVLTRFDAASGKAIAQIDLPSSCGPGAIYAFGSVWAVGEQSRELYRIDPVKNKVVGTTPLHGEPFAASADATSIWINSRKDNVLDRIDGVTGTVVATIQTGFRGPEDITTDAGQV